MKSVAETTWKKEIRDYAKMTANVCYTSQLEPIPVTEALKVKKYVLAMQEELLQFERNKVCGSCLSQLM